MLLKSKTEKEIEDMAIDSTLIWKLMQRQELTPDFNKLKFHKYIPIFVYDQLMTSWKSSIILQKQGVKYLGMGKTAAEAYTFHKYYNLSAGQGVSNPYYVVLPDNKKHSTARGHILGDVYAVPPTVLLTLDKLYNNGTLFYRKSTSVFLSDQRDKKSNGYPCKGCFMYLGVPEAWENLRLISMSKYTVHKSNKMVRNYYRNDPNPTEYRANSTLGPRWHGPLAGLDEGEDGEQHGMFDPNFMRHQEDESWKHMMH